MIKMNLNCKVKVIHLKEVEEDLIIELKKIAN